MSLTFENVNDNPIAKIQSSDGNFRYLYLDVDADPDDSDEEKDEFDFESLTDEQLRVVTSGMDKGIPMEDMLSLIKPTKSQAKTFSSITTERGEIMVDMPTQYVNEHGQSSERIYISGKSGLGKSTLVVSYAQEYQKIHPENNIHVFSRHEEDPVYGDDFEYEQIVCSEDLLGANIQLDDLRNSLVIFDDCDNLGALSKPVDKYIQRLVDDLMSNGRKYSISVAYLGHQVLNYAKTRGIINEANKVILFNNSLGKHNKAFLDTYCGFSKSGIEYVTSLKSRWFEVVFGVVPYILHEHGCFIIPKLF